MREFRGTKGDWLIDPLNTISIIDSSGDLMSQLICQINGKWDKEEKKANALLISKAPEMLEMVKRCEFWISACNEDANILKDISELIKEATEF